MRINPGYSRAFFTRWGIFIFRSPRYPMPFSEHYGYVKVLWKWRGWRLLKKL